MKFLDRFFKKKERPKERRKTPILYKDTTQAILKDLAKKLKEHDKRVMTQFDLLPKSVLKELNHARKTMPLLYPQIEQSIKDSIPDIIDRKIIKIIEDSHNVTSLDLLNIVETQRICSRNTLYGHLKNLETRGYIRKYREGHKVVYTLHMKTEKIPEDSPTL